MKQLFGRILGSLLAVWVASAGDYELVVHFGDPAEVVDRTPNGGPNYLGPGHPHAESFRFPLREFSITPLRNVAILGFRTPTNGLQLRRSQSWVNAGPDVVPTPVGSERFKLFLMTEQTNLFPVGKSLVIPETFPLSGGSVLSYDFLDQYYGGGFEGLYQLFADVIAYDVRIVSFEILPVAEPAPPQLVAKRLNDNLVLNWSGDAFRGYQVQLSTSPLGPWLPLTGVPSGEGSQQTHFLPLASLGEGGYFRLVARNQQ